MKITRFSMEITEQLQCSELAMQLRPGRRWRQPLFQHGFRGNLWIDTVLWLPFPVMGDKNGMEFYPLLPLIIHNYYKLLPSGYVKIAIENCTISWSTYSTYLKMVIFHSYGCLPEGDNVVKPIIHFIPLHFSWNGGWFIVVCATLPLFQGFSSELSLQPILGLMAYWKKKSNCYFQTSQCLLKFNFKAQHI